LIPASVLEALKAHAPELKKLGVLSVSLFGSTARDEADTDSDVDLAVTLTEGPKSGLAYLARIDDLKEKLAAIVGRPVDVIVEPTSRPRLQQEIDRDRHLAF
jgi:predicted nucleotidyltransferase